MRYEDGYSVIWQKSSYSGGNTNACLEVSTALPHDAGWLKSSYSNAGSECVEYHSEPSTVKLRDTQHRHHTTLTFPAPVWNDFIAALKSGDMQPE